jgi:hypothetical protein
MASARPSEFARRCPELVKPILLKDAGLCVSQRGFLAAWVHMMSHGRLSVPLLCTTSASDSSFPSARRLEAGKGKAAYNCLGAWKGERAEAGSGHVGGADGTKIARVRMERCMCSLDAEVIGLMILNGWSTRTHIEWANG